MGNQLKGVSEEALEQSFENILNFAKIARDDYVSKRIDINKQLQELEKQHIQNKIANSQSTSTLIVKDQSEKEEATELPEVQKLFQSDDPKNYMLQMDYFIEGAAEWAAKPKLLLVHGFGGCGAVFYRMIEHLRKSFRVTTIDLLGLAGSGRPSFSLKTAQQCIDYFVISIEAWMQATGYSQEEYVLCGHSLGGYLSVHYSMRFSHNLSRLVLLSPVGVPRAPEDFSAENVAQKSDSAAGAFLFRRLGQFWEWHISPFTPMRKSGYVGANKLLTGYVNRRLLSLKDPLEKEAFKNVLLQTCMRDISSESSISMILGFGAFAKIPLVDLLEHVPVPICFQYGDNDWMQRKVPDELKIKGKFKEGTIIRTIEKSGHHIYVDNETGCVATILEFVLGRSKKTLFLQQLAQERLLAAEAATSITANEPNGPAEVAQNES